MKPPLAELYMVVLKGKALVNPGTETVLLQDSGEAELSWQNRGAE